MRTKLKEIGNKTRERYTAIIGRCGVKYNDFKGFPERTVVLKDVRLANSNKITTDHLWVTVGKTLSELDLKAGDVILFDARVGIYKKGSHFRKRDYKLNRMTKIEVQRADRDVVEDEVTTATPITIKEWQEMREMKELEKQYPEGCRIEGFDFELEDIERLKELKNQFKRRYYGITNNEIEKIS